jgi:hypothetical protein
MIHILTLILNPPLRVLISTATSNKLRTVLDSEDDDDDMEPVGHLHFCYFKTMALLAASLNKATLQPSHSHNTLFARPPSTMPLYNHAVHITPLCSHDPPF